MTVDVQTLQPHQQRVVKEYEDLRDRTIKLGTFLGLKVFADLDKAEQERMLKQWKIMQELGLVLSERIAAFQPPLVTPEFHY